MNDQDLLQRYLRENSQEAFSRLVQRYIDLVYSAARRQTRSPQMAEEVAQSVFTELARKGHRLKPGTPLPAWLHLVTRRMAINAVRSETRRQVQEAAAGSIAAMNTSSIHWPAIEPLLDEAVDALPEQDRVAVIMRYFDKRSLRDVGTNLGISEDAAQKRISRALERMRTFLVRRGATVTSAGLATDLWAHAVQSAPLALGTTIAAGSGIAATIGASVLQSSGTVAMISLKKIIVGGLTAVTLGGATFSAISAYRRGQDAAELRDAVAMARRELIGLQSGRAAQLSQIAALRNRLDESNDWDRSGTYPEMDAGLRAWLDREATLRAAFVENPEWSIPELEYLTDEDWASAAEEIILETPEQLRQALAGLRTRSRMIFGSQLRIALHAYAGEHDGDLPNRPTDLAPYFDSPINPAILPQYEMNRTGKLEPSSGPGSGPSATNAVISRQVVDPEYDVIFRQGPLGNGFRYNSALEEWIVDAKAAYRESHGNEDATDPAALLPYVPASVTIEQIARNF